jgi:hypothetical protein
MLKITNDQKAKLAELQKEVDSKLAALLTEDRNKQLESLRNRASHGGGRPEGPPGGN